MNCKANVFTRVLPTYEGITKAFGSCIKNPNIAILQPSRGEIAFQKKNFVNFGGQIMFYAENLEVIPRKTGKELFLEVR